MEKQIYFFEIYTVFCLFLNCKYMYRNFQHKMGGHVPGINHHPVPDRVLPKKWPWVQSFCRDHSWMLEGLIEYIFFIIFP